jgi:hypothetical protein
MSFQIARDPRGVKVPYVQVTQAATAIATNTFTNPDFTATTYDNGLATCGASLADLPNNTVLLKRAGLWFLSCHFSWAANNNGYRQGAVYANSGFAAEVVAAELNNNFSGFFGADHTASGLFYATTNTWFAYGSCYQNSGGNLNCTATLKAVWLGPF